MFSTGCGVDGQNRFPTAEGENKGLKKHRAPGNRMNFILFYFDLTLSEHFSPQKNGRARKRKERKMMYGKTQHLYQSNAQDFSSNGSHGSYCPCWPLLSTSVSNGHSRNINIALYSANPSSTSSSSYAFPSHNPSATQECRCT